MKKLSQKMNIKNITLIYIITYFIIALFYCGINGIMIIGEWDDYTYPAVTLITQHKISISESDIPIIKQFYPEWAENINSTGINYLSGKYTRSGENLTWYFPTYALTCIPMISILKFLRLPVTYAFCFTNLFAVMAVLLVIYNCLQINDKFKLIIIVLLSANPVMFYYCWASGEVIIYSFLALGLVCWYNKWYKRAAFFVSLAGTLNPTIMSIGIIMIIEYMILLLQKKSKDISWKHFITKNARDVLKYGSCYIIGLVPMIYFYYHTGHINLTASHEGFTSGTESTLQRFAAYLFDLNFGILPYYPVILILGFILLLIACAKRHWRYIEWFTAFAVNVFLYSIMIHINSGMSGMARYNTWGVVILVFAVCLFLPTLVYKTSLKTILQIGIGINAVTLLLIVYLYGPNGADKTSYINWTPIAEYVLDHCPAVYSPLHSTFNSRTIHQDGGYSYTLPVIYTSKDGSVRKILCSESEADYLRQSLVSETDNVWLNKEIDSLDTKETYISIPAKYKVFQCETYTLNSELLFDNTQYNIQSYGISGISEAEEWGAWTLGNELQMRFKTESNKQSLHGYIDCGVYNNSQSYIIYVNDEKIADGVTQGGIEFDFNNPGSGNVIYLRIILPDAVSPYNLTGAPDTRVLALGIKRIIFT